MRSKMSHVQVIALGYFIMILVGALLLMLPAASADGRSAPFSAALFTSTSASCVTGLIVRDTATGWSGFGQAVILALIQVGGLGFMTIATLFYLLMRRRMGLRQREIMVESINTTQVGGIMRTTRTLVKRTLLFEGCGALLLSIRFIPQFGLGRGIWYSVFHAVSAFCNAGFDLMGVFAPYGSLVPYAGDALVNLVIMALITIGGLGFLVWEDLRRNGLHWKRYRLHTKLVLTVSAILTFGGALLLYLLEAHATGQGLSQPQRVLTALFASVTARTAGFNTVDVAAMSEGGKLTTILLMAVGGSPGSTAGGIRTTTIAVVVLYAISSFRGQAQPSVFGRRLSEQALRKSSNILLFNVGLVLGASLVICSVQGIALLDVLFETFSAIGTVGMSTGITRELAGLCKGLVIALMYLGRVGSVSFAVALLEKKARPPDVPAEIDGTGERRSVADAGHGLHGLVLL